MIKLFNKFANTNDPEFQKTPFKIFLKKSIFHSDVKTKSAFTSFITFNILKFIHIILYFLVILIDNNNPIYYKNAKYFAGFDCGVLILLVIMSLFLDASNLAVLKSNSLSFGLFKTIVLMSF